MPEARQREPIQCQRADRSAQLCVPCRTGEGTRETPSGRVRLSRWGPVTMRANVRANVARARNIRLKRSRCNSHHPSCPSSSLSTDASRHLDKSLAWIKRSFGGYSNAARRTAAPAASQPGEAPSDLKWTSSRVRARCSASSLSIQYAMAFLSPFASSGSK